MTVTPWESLARPVGHRTRLADLPPSVRECAGQFDGFLERVWG